MRDCILVSLFEDVWSKLFHCTHKYTLFSFLGQLSYLVYENDCQLVSTAKQKQFQGWLHEKN